MNRPTALAALVLALFVVATSALAQGGRSGSIHPPEHGSVREEQTQTLRQLYSMLATRPGITADTDRRALLPAIHAGAAPFADTFRHDKRLQRFVRELKLLLVACNAQMASAADGLAGAETRGSATDRLLSGILDVAKQARIHPEEVDMALLQGAAAMEASLRSPSAAKALTPEDREVISLLLLNGISQFHRRAMSLAEPSEAMALLGTAPSAMADHAQRLAWSGPALATELVALEKSLSDPGLLGSRENLIMLQFNTEAVNDLFLVKVALELSVPDDRLDLAPLATKMASMGGIMADMTESRLLESGAVPSNVRYLAAFNGVEPSSPLAYTPDPALADRLAPLGVTPPNLPDFSPFASPYRDIFQLRHDLSLCDLIASAEWRAAEDQVSVLGQRPLSLAERLTLRKADSLRRQGVMARLLGATPQEKHAIRILLSGFFGR